MPFYITKGLGTHFKFPWRLCGPGKKMCEKFTKNHTISDNLTQPRTHVKSKQTPPIIMLKHLYVLSTEDPLLSPRSLFKSSVVR